MVLVDETQNVGSRTGNPGPECDAHGGTHRYAHAISKREHRIEDSAHGIGQTPSVHHGNGSQNVASAAEEPRPVGFELRLAQCLAFNDRMMSHPNLRFGGRAPPPRRQDRADIRRVLGLHEKLGECRMGRIGRGGRKHELRVGCDLQVPVRLPRIHDRYAAHFRVVLRRHDYFEDRA